MGKIVFVERHNKIGDLVCCEPVFRILKNKRYYTEFITSPIGKEIYKFNPYIDNFIIKNDINNKLNAGDKSNILVNLHWIEKGEVINNYFPDANVEIKIHRLNALYIYSLTEIFLLKLINVLNYKEKNNVTLESLKNKYDLNSYIHIPNFVENKINMELNFLKSRNYVIIHRFSNDPSKNENEMSIFWDNIIKYIINAGFYVLEMGGKDVSNFKINQEIRKSSRYIDLRGKLSLLETAYVVKKAYSFVGMMSGVSHIANSAKVPSLIISRQYAHYDYHNPYFGFLNKDRNVKILFYKNSASKELNMRNIYYYLSSLLKDRSFNSNKNNISIKNRLKDAKRVNFFLEKNNSFAIWGAGSYGKGVINILKSFSKNISFFIDSDKHKQGTEIEGIKTISPMDLKKKLKNEKIIIASLWWVDIKNYLENEFKMKRWIDFI